MGFPGFMAIANCMVCLKSQVLKTGPTCGVSRFNDENS